jgi:DNA-binding CsgD family transcriptional regulator
MRAEGMTETQIAKGMGFKNTSELRPSITIAREQQKQERIAKIEKLSLEGMSPEAIGKELGISGGTVRSLQKPAQETKKKALDATVDMLRSQVDKKTYLDIGSGVENTIGVSETRLKAAVAVLKNEGYEVHKVQLDQMTGANKTVYKLLTPPGTTYVDAVKNKDKIQQIDEFSDDGGSTFYGIKPPKVLSADRVKVKYAEDGGAAEDGLIYVRPGVKDVSIGESRYAQVRIAVEGDRYLKGMAIYKDDLPPGIDVVFNTNKSNTGNKLDAMKKYKEDIDGNVDPENPFGAKVSRQILEVGKDGKERPSSVMNIVNEEGSWEDWSRTLSPQVLSKQNTLLAQRQLKSKYDKMKAEFDEINAITNPTVKKKLLQSFSDDADSSAVHLKAAALPRSSYHVLIPVNSLKSTEIYAPNYKHGERVALIRFPHGGTFEIPDVVVNNNHKDAKNLLGNARDAIGINSKVAEKLSGADFDGDAVLVIPNDRGDIKSSPSLSGLKNFDPKASYHNPNLPEMTKKQKAMQMGNATNLISDMTLKGASTEELARAVRHSMVVIDAEKHKLDYKQSAKDHNIKALKEKYQGGPRSGAATLITRAGSDYRVEERKLRKYSEGGPIDPATGRLVYTPTGKTHVNKRGETIKNTTKVDRLSVVDDAFTLSSGTKMEEIYAAHSNALKKLANDARKNTLSVKDTPYSKKAKEAYPNEVASLNAKLNQVRRNRPLERQAQVFANAIYAAKREANPHMEDDEAKKVKSQALLTARNRVGLKPYTVDFTPSEWAAIQAGAISPFKLTELLNKANMSTVKTLAAPKPKQALPPASMRRAQTMLRMGRTQAEVAEALGVSVSTLKRVLAES